MTLLYNRDLLFFIPKDEGIWLSMQHGIYEYFELSHSLLNIKEGDTVVDVGACIGFYSVVLGERVGNTGKVYAIEPCNVNCCILHANSFINAFNWVIPYKLGCWNKDEGHCYLDINEKNAGDHHFCDVLGTEKTNLVRLDDLKINKVDFIKIDTQGMELDTLLGARNTILRQKSLSMLVEYYPKGMKEIGKDPRELVDLIFDLGFRVFSFAPHKTIGDQSKMKVDFAKGYDVKHMTRQSVLDAVDPSTGYFINLWCQK